MGSVYEIEHELTKHRRALKMLHAAMTQIPGVVERFLREASAAGRVGNPHIVETFDAGKLDSGEPYLVMEMLRGEPLSTRIERGPMPIADVVDLIGQACDGIQAAHDAGIVHRDLKPDNLFVTEVDGRPFVKILDFGISKFDPGKTGGLALTQEGAALGTPYYMSPEQIRGETSLDARADIYAMGVILYECVAGVRPFEADALTQLAVLIHTGNAKPLEQHRPDLPPGFAEVVRKAMAMDRANRFQSAGELRAALERFGAISFRTRPGGGVTPSIPPPRSAVGAQSLATSAAGVSMRDVRAPQDTAKKGQLGPILAGFGVLGALAIGGVVFLRSGPAPVAEPSASPHVSGSPAPPVADTHPSPADTEHTAPAPPPPAPPPSAAASAAPKPSGFPVVAPILPPPQAPAPANVKSGGAVSAPSTPATPKPRRAEEKGLAKDNPFR
jgi:serine/threonine-protein kinase